jgi:nucleotide-binding universal stress UspA family protein
MLFPVFYGFIAPDAAAAEPLAGMKTIIDLAGKLDAQLSVAIGALQLSVSSLLTSATVEGLISAENQRAATSAAAANDRVLELAMGSGLTPHTEILKGNLDQLKVRFAMRARLHGLVVAETGKPGELLGGELVEPLIFDSGRPVLILPSGYDGAISLDQIVIAWDGSTGAARAVWDSLPLLRLAKRLEIVTVTGEKKLGDTAPASALAPMLSFLGKDITVTALKFEGVSAASLIRNHAARIGAGLIVQGAYGRSRWREFVLGGVTREMLRESALPILMSH